MEGLLSVIVPVYNARESIGKCLDSILAQTYQNLEVIVVDDGSTDGSSEICDAYSRRDSRVLCIHTANGGPAKARNAGLRRMSGRYLAFVDADDYIEADLYGKLLSELQSQQAVMIISGWYHHDVAGGTIRRRKPAHAKDLCAGQLKKGVLRGTDFCGGGYPWNKLIDCDAVSRMVFFNESLSIYEDLVWLLEILDSMQPGDKVRLSTCTGYHYNDRPDSLSHLWTIPQYRSMVLAWDILSQMTKIQGQAGHRRDVEIVDAIWGICKNRGNADDLFAAHRELFQMRRFFPDMRRCLKIALVKGYCKAGVYSWLHVK